MSAWPIVLYAYHRGGFADAVSCWGERDARAVARDLRDAGYHVVWQWETTS